MSIESRLANDEPIIYPKEIVWLCLLSTLMIVTGSVSPIFLADSWANIPMLITLEPVWFIYWKAWHGANKSLFMYELKCLQLSEKEHAYAMEGFYEKYPWAK